MKKQVIIISGSINSGKTSVAKQLVKMLPKTCHIEIDALREIVRFLNLHDSIDINLENTILIGNNLLDKGYNLVITYPLSEEDLKFLMQGLHDKAEKFYFFSLKPNISIATSNRGSRELTKDEIERIKYHYANKLAEGIVIDNTKQTVEETVNTINKIISG